MVFLWFSYGLKHGETIPDHPSPALPGLAVGRMVWIFHGELVCEHRVLRKQCVGQGGKSPEIYHRRNIYENHRKTIGKWWFNGI